MRCVMLGRKGTWQEVINSCNTTIGKDVCGKEPSSEWKKRILLAEHSPIRQLWIKAKWFDLMSWVSVHFVRHWLGIVHWVKSQRPDRLTDVKIDRNKEPQDTLIQHEIDVNAQAMINISRKRLCSMAMPETREAWKAFLEQVKEVEPELYNVCVPDCVYRGYCYEYKTCGFHKTEQFKKMLEQYRKNINE